MTGAVVQDAYNVDDSGGSSTTIAVTLTGVATGNLLVAHVGWADVGATGKTCSVSDGSAFSTGDAQRTDVPNEQLGQVFYRENVGSGSHTITATFSSTTISRRIRVYEVSGVTGSGARDTSIGQAQTNPGTGVDNITTGASSATTNANDFIMEFAQDTGEVDPGTGTLSAGTGYTTYGSNRIMACGTKSVSATGAQTGTFTQSTNFSVVSHVVAFIEGSGGGGGGVSVAWLTA